MKKNRSFTTLACFEKRESEKTTQAIELLKKRYTKFSFSLLPVYDTIEIGVHQKYEASPITPQLEAEMYGYFCGAYDALTKK